MCLIINNLEELMSSMKIEYLFVYSNCYKNIYLFPKGKRILEAYSVEKGRKSPVDYFYLPFGGSH